MPLLANLLILLFGRLAEFFTKYVSKRFLFAAVYITAVTALTVASYAAVKAVATAISLTVPNQFNAMASWVMPGNWKACVSAVAAAEVIQMIMRFRLNLELAVISKA